MSIKAFERNFWLVIKPADDVPGQWVGHCLDLDIVSVGTSLSHAIEMTAEAVCECIVDDLTNDRHPLERRAAPAEFYAELSRIQSSGEYSNTNALPSDAAVIAAVQVQVSFHGLRLVDHPQRVLPPAWLMAKYNSARHVDA
jgi:hypothetical protein